jgi:DNA-binding MarR family transcriptional regulator
MYICFENKIKMKYTLLKQVLNHLENFHEESDSERIEDFVLWLNQQIFNTPKNADSSQHDELMIAFKTMHFSKELKRQAKGILSESALYSIDEYSFLLHLNHAPSFRKMEIIEMHNLEAPTGVEVIKRLIKNGYVNEFADPNDKRAKRISINESGTEVLAHLEPKMNAMFTEVVSDLNLDQQVQFSGMLDILLKSYSTDDLEDLS